MREESTWPKGLLFPHFALIRQVDIYMSLKKSVNFVTIIFIYFCQWCKKKKIIKKPKWKVNNQNILVALL